MQINHVVTAVILLMVSATIAMEFAKQERPHKSPRVGSSAVLSIFNLE